MTDVLQSISEEDLLRFQLVARYCDMADVNIADAMNPDLDKGACQPLHERARELLGWALREAAFIEDRVAGEMCHIRIGESAKLAKSDMALLGLVAYLRSQYSDSPIVKRLYG